MNIKDIFTLVGTRFKIHRLRVFITILTISILYGIVIGVLFIAQGLFANLEQLNIEAYGDKIIVQPYYNRSDTKNADARVRELVAQFGGDVIGHREQYCSAGLVSINGATLLDTKGPNWEYQPCSPDFPGELVTVLDGNLLDRFIAITPNEDDIIQVIAPTSVAARLVGISTPSSKDPHLIAKVGQYVKEVTEKAVGHRFMVTVTSDDVEETYVYEIVGVWPTRDVSVITPGEGNFIESQIPTSLGYYENMFYIVNPNSDAFRKAYIKETETPPAYLVAFDSTEQLFNLRDYMTTAPDNGLPIYADGIFSELFGTRIADAQHRQSFDKAVSIFAIFFTIIATVIMAGTLNRVLDDERSSIALYRSVGATSKDIIKLFAWYLLILALLIVLTSTFIGLLLSLGATLLETGVLTAGVKVAFIRPDLSMFTLLAWNPKILSVWASIVIIALLCLGIIAKRLTLKNVIKELKR